MTSNDEALLNDQLYKGGTGMSLIILDIWGKPQLRCHHEMPVTGAVPWSGAPVGARSR